MNIPEELFLVDPEEEKRKQGITENLVRFSVGIEDVGDLKNDLNQALKKASDES